MIRGGYGRHVEGGKQDVVEIYKEDVAGTKVFRCPFCDVKPLGSDIRFRKHLKTHHPQQKTLLRDSVRPDGGNRIEESQETLPLEIFFPKPLLEKVEDMVRLDVNKVNEAESKPELVIMEEEEVLESDRVGDDENSFFLLPEGRSGSIEGFVRGDLCTVKEREDKEVCGVCGNLILGYSCEAGEEETMTKVVEGVLGIPTGPNIMCSTCREVASDIVRTKESIRHLQHQLALAVGRLSDLASLGKRLAEEDIAQGGLCSSDGASVVVRVVEEGRLDPSLPHLGLSVVAQYNGKLLDGSQVKADDGSRPETSKEEDGGGVYLTQEEWARGGLGMCGGEVQVPAHLLVGLGVGQRQAKVLVSKALAVDLPRPFFCSECDQSFGALGSLAEHLQRHFDGKKTRKKNNITADHDFAVPDFESPFKGEERSFKEQPCIKDLTHTDKYRIELRSYMHQEQFKDCRNEVPSLEKPFQCKECNKTFARAHDLWGHHASYRGPAFKCNFQSCDEVFLRLPDFAVHYSAHGGQRLIVPESAAEKKILHITCPVCQTVVPGLYKLQRHKMKHDPELKYKCPACPKQFVKANTLRAHISNVHKGSKPQKKCKKCDAIVFSDNGLFAHMKSAHGEECHACASCGEIFLLESQLVEHMLIHNNQSKLLKSNDPEPGGGNESALRQCPECETTILPTETMSEHFATAHQDAEQRFQCSECNGVVGEQERFLTLEGARRHYRQVHTSRPHTCWACKQSFGKEAALHLHLASAHPEVVGEEEEGAVQCLHCTQVFPSHTERVSHTRYYHMVETIDITSTELDEVLAFYNYPKLISLSLGDHGGRTCD